jgi:hypothetical protein
MKAIPTRSAETISLYSRPHMWLILAVLAQMLMEITLVSLWYQALFPMLPLTWPVIFTLLTILFTVSYALARLTSLKRQVVYTWRVILLRQALFLAWFIIALLASLRLMVFAGRNITLFEMLRHPEFFFTHAGVEGAGFAHLLTIALIIWRASFLSRSPVSQSGIQRSFQVGLVLLMIYGMGQAPAHPREAAAGLYFYLFWALICMSATRITSLSDERSGRIPRFGSGWLLGILITALGFVGLAILAGWLASQRIVTWFISGLALIFGAITALVFSLLTPLLTLLARFISEFIELLRQLVKRFSSTGVPETLQNLAEQLGQAVSKAIPFNIGSRMIIIAAVFFFIGFTLLLGIRFRAYQRRMEEEENSQMDPSVGSTTLQKMIQRLLPASLNIRLRSPGQILAAARIRYIYRRLIALSLKHGVERSPSVTPLEFIPQLSAIFPGETAAVELITAAYTRIRYGEYPETIREVEEVQRAWDAVRQHRK